MTATRNTDAARRLADALDRSFSPRDTENLVSKQRLATNWSDIGTFGDKLMGELGTPREQYEARSYYNELSDAQRSAFWSAYYEVGQSPLGQDAHGRPDGKHFRYDRDVAGAERLVAVLHGEDDSFTGDTVEFVEAQPVHRGVFGDALDAEWSARRPLVKGYAGRSVAREDTPEQIADREAGVIDEFVATELNRRIAVEERNVREARRCEETLVVVDRCAVTLVPPRVARTLEATWDVERCGWRLVAVQAENKRWYFDRSPETALAKAEQIVARLKARGVPTRTWRPDNTPERTRIVKAFRYWKEHARMQATAGERETYSFERWSAGRLAEVLEELDPTEVAA